MKSSPLILSAMLLAYGVSGAEWQCNFAAGQWDESQWLRTKSPRWSHAGGWVQQEQRIANEVPADATELEMLGVRAPETYSSMLWRQKITGPVTVSSRMEFTDRMAPLLVFAPELADSEGGVPEYREHWEVVLWDEGINVWHHDFKDGAPVWYLQAQLKARFEPDTIYDLQVKLTPRGERSEMRISCGGHEFSFESDQLPQEFFAGITGCEGVNYFYDFRVGE